MEYFNDTSEDTMNAETDIMNTDCDAESTAYYGYDEDRAIYGYEDRVSSEIMDSFPEGPGSPLPADRLARKQRLFLRRGGACHSTLLQSAVMACMSSPKDDEGKPGFSSLESSVSLLTSSSGETSATSPRKRLRRTDRPKAVVDDKVVAGASVLLASLSMSPLDGGGTSDHHQRSGPDFKRAPPIRRVSLRKSYNSVASGASDYDEEFAELLDRDD